MVVGSGGQWCGVVMTEGAGDARGKEVQWDKVADKVHLGFQ